MQLNWIGYQFRDYDGYGRFSNRYLPALARAGVQVRPLLAEQVHRWTPAWLQERWGIDWARLTISCLPPIYLQPVSGRHWIYTMTEGSEVPPGWAEIINASGVERVLVPCAHNAQVFREGGVLAPVSVVPGGTDPDEFPLRNHSRWFGVEGDAYTFLALGDRGARKGWVEVWQAFYRAFGTPQDTPDVRLVIKSRPQVNELLDRISQAENLDPRISIQQEDAECMAEVYAEADCVVLPSRSEGWGMPHREAAMMGLPVITQAYSGLDDGHTQDWAMVVNHGTLEAIPTAFESIAGQWMKADVAGLADAMRRCYADPLAAVRKGHAAARWLRAHQTWDHAAAWLVELLTQEGAWR